MTQFDQFISSILNESYFIKSDKIIHDIQSILGKTNSHIRKINNAVHVTVTHDDASNLMKSLKSKSYLCFYQYPAHEPIRILVFTDSKQAQLFFAKNPKTQGNFVPFN